jgi:hypothetical protein
MKNKLFKTCLAGLALSVAGLANAETIFKEQLTSHAAISAAAISIAAGSFVDGHIASQAAVTTGAGSEVKNIVSGAATGIGADAKTCDIYAGAAIAVGAGSKVGVLTAGGAVTLGAMAKENEICNSAAAIVTTDFDAANTQIESAQSALDTLPANGGILYAYTFLAGNLEPGVYEGGAITIPANTVITFDANGQNGVWIFKLSGAMTVGAGSQFEIINAGDNNAVIWDIGGALTLGAGSTFLGTAFVEGAVSGATATVSCGNLYATGAISIGSIGSIGGDDCKVSADQLADFEIESLEWHIPAPDADIKVCKLWDQSELESLLIDGFSVTAFTEDRILTFTGYHSDGGAGGQSTYASYSVIHVPSKYDPLGMGDTAMFSRYSFPQWEMISNGRLVTINYVVPNASNLIGTKADIRSCYDTLEAEIYRRGFVCNSGTCEVP